ncbi:MAG: hypothetical protein JSW54_08220 [Fidelibacterota bacterium]|nr:MAG: hypothetical protein JSW54_08220 [Candidatus Neomarinimicrobiota bacterium]
MSTISWRWWLAVPVAILAWLLVDTVAAYVLDILFLYSHHVIVFLSHLAAVLAAGLVAPPGFSRLATTVVAVIFISIRLVMVVTVWNEDSIVHYLIGTLAMIAGLGLGIYIVARRLRQPLRSPGADSSS